MVEGPVSEPYIRLGREEGADPMEKLKRSLFSCEGCEGRGQKNEISKQLHEQIGCNACRPRLDLSKLGLSEEDE